jgi:hypothetical protein
MASIGLESTKLEKHISSPNKMFCRKELNFHSQITLLCCVITYLLLISISSSGFAVYYQGNLSVVDFLCCLQDLADMVGNLGDADVLAFWCQCKPYLKAELTQAGYEPSELTCSELEVLATQIDHADEVAHEMHKGSLLKPIQSCGESKQHLHNVNPPQSTQLKPNNGLS